jgi:hypothetical protein
MNGVYFRLERVECAVVYDDVVGHRQTSCPGGLGREDFMRKRRIDAVPFGKSSDL